MRAAKSFPTILVMGLAAVMVFGDFAGARASGDDLTVRGGAIFFNRPEFDSVVLVEFPFTLQRQEFEFFRPDSVGSGYFARIFAQINLYGADGLPVDSANTYFSAVVPNLTSAREKDYSLFNSLVLVIHPGVYSARLTVIDVVSKKEGRFFYDRIIVEPPIREGLALGAKCLAFGISYVGDSPAAAGTGVPKNGYEVLCNPLGIYSEGDTAVFLYAELYNLDYSADHPSNYRLSFAALNDSGQVVYQLGSKVRPKPGRSAVVVESFDILGWPAGTYLLQIKASDSSTNQEITHEIPLWIVAPTASASELAAVIGEDDSDRFDLETQLRLVYYLLIPDEKATLDGLTDKGKLTFLNQYWQEHDSDPATEVIENRVEMYERYLYANNFFSLEENKTDGWFSDRGRVLMVYGLWDDIEDIPHPTNGYPYQVWHYYSYKKGILFVFQDKSGLGDYRLMHSNVDGEIFSKAWDKAIKTGVIPIE